MAQDEILIRAFEPRDIAALTENLNQPGAVWGTPQTAFVSVGQRRARQEARRNSAQGYHTQLAAVIGGKVIGWADLAADANPRRSHVATFGMAVHDAYAGRGAGRAAGDPTAPRLRSHISTANRPATR